MIPPRHREIFYIDLTLRAGKREVLDSLLRAFRVPRRTRRRFDPMVPVIANQVTW